MNITLANKIFQPLISNDRILERIGELAREINRQFEFQNIEILVVLDGAEAFSKAIHPLLTFQNSLHFIRVKTYDGMNSVPIFNVDLNFLDTLKGKTVLILEDIIDSGFTVFQLIDKLKEKHISSIHLATLLLKPDQLKFHLKLDFTGFEIGPDFVVGFGMDYMELGRDLQDIYSCINGQN